jgi:hypothetical protein
MLIIVVQRRLVMPRLCILYMEDGIVCKACNSSRETAKQSVIKAKNILKMGRMYQWGGGVVTQATQIGTGFNSRNVMIPFLRMPFVYYIHYEQCTYFYVRKATYSVHSSTYSA